jgi:hypothetical protein
MKELGIATLTSQFFNANRDPKKGEPAKPSDFFYFQSQEEDGIHISAYVANTFFALTEQGKLPGWAVAIAPLERLLKAKDNSKIRNPQAWIGKNLVLICPTVKDGLVEFPLGFVDDTPEGEFKVNSGYLVKVPRYNSSWILNGKFAVKL